MFAKSMLEISALVLLQPPACRIESSPGADCHPGLLIIEEENLHNIKMQFFANFVKNMDQTYAC